MKRGVDILVIGDAHAKPGVPNSRFKWAGKYAFDKKPDVIIDMGDWADMPSLSLYDVGKASFEGRRYREDIEAALEARNYFQEGIDLGNRGIAKRKKAKYIPQKIALGGNHCEGRIRRVLETDPKLIGTLSHHDLGYKKFGWEYIPYQDYYRCAGLTFSHFFPSGVMGRPIGGEMPALSLLRKQFTSCVAGHSHLFDIAHRTRPDGGRIWGVVAGCYLDPSQWEDYAGPANLLWWRGLILLKDVVDGDIGSIETVTATTLKEMYD